jgi:molybdopterin synthase sulfur carrier subunit
LVKILLNDFGVSNESLTHNLEFLLKVNVKLFASVRKFSRKENLEINIKEDSSVKDLLSKIGIPEDEPVLVIVNEYTQGKETMLQDGDTLCLFPIIAGG